MKIFKWLDVQELLLGIGSVCHRFLSIVQNAKELWVRLETQAEFTQQTFHKAIVSHASFFKVLTMQHSQKIVTYNSRDNYIEYSFSSCKNIVYLDLSYNTSLVTTCFLRSMTYIKILKLVGCTSICPEDTIEDLKHRKPLEVIDISECFQFNDDHCIG